MQRGKLTEEQKQEICERYEAGESSYGLAREFDVTSGTICYQLGKAGIPRRKTAKLTESLERDIAGRYCNGETTFQIAETLSLCQKTVSKVLRRNNIAVRGDTDGTKYSHKLTENDKRKIVDMYETGFSTHDLAKLFSVNQRAVWGLLKRRQVRLRTYSETARKYVVNETYFQDINSEEKAYWLGFICADGCVYGDSLQITLSSRDRDHIQKFKKAIQSQHPIREYNQPNTESRFARLHIASKKIVETLAKFGVVRNKTSSLTFPNLAESSQQHFVRGIFDGDGCISKRRADAVFTIAGTHNLLEEIQNLLIVAGTTKTKICDTRRGCWVLYYGGRNNLKRIYRYLYTDATIWLDRKKEKFEEILFGDKLVEKSDSESNGIVPLTNSSV